jgi:dTDP-4-dehydrorhamnose reductase
LDITDEVRCEEKISRLKPDIIVNAAAYNAVDNAEKDTEKAMAINGYALRHLAEIAAKIGAVFVHYSTDYVFDGKNPKGYKEDDEPNPASAYGQSKFVGERMILMTAFHNSGGGCGGCAASHGCHKIAAMKPLRYYIIRTSWLYGKNGKNFVDTMIALSESRGLGTELKVVNDQHGKPTYAADLAKTTKTIIEGKLPYGIYHFTNETMKKGITWYDFAKEIFRIINFKEKISAKGGSAVGGKVKPVTTKEFYSGNKNYLAARPEFSMLINTKLPKARDWKEALKEYLLGGLASK